MARKIVIGTIRPPQFCESEAKISKNDLRWFYGSRHNRFWRVMEEFSGERFETEGNLKRFSQKQSIGFIDIIKKCDRAKPSASDGDLRNIELIDIFSVINDNINDEIRIFFTSRQAAKWFNKSVADSGAKELIIMADNRLKPETRSFGGKTISALTLWSPSNRAARARPENWREQYGLLLD
ncbi:MAG: hypothetical protein LBT81_05200 [Helicobacteraceae bacterium]|jgi:G:T/U-mismatch repair DNA glycosylase|nr:hypothetical protein [Helicobacteraceae bacterium]